MNSLVVQSFRRDGLPAWIDACLASVREWAADQGHAYRFLGDELFELVPSWYMNKVAGRLPVATDYARLVLMRQVLEDEEFDQVIWLDADVLVIDPTLCLECSGSCAFGQETWIQEEKGKLQTRKNVHNAVCLFRRENVVLPFLIETVASIIRRVDGDRIAPQMVGPKLLSSLHSLCDFDLLPEVGALSPALAAAIGAGGGRALELFREQSSRPPKALNLCASLISPGSAALVIDQLATGKVTLT